MYIYHMHTHPIGGKGYILSEADSDGDDDDDDDNDDDNDHHDDEKEHSIAMTAKLRSFKWLIPKPSLLRM